MRIYNCNLLTRNLSADTADQGSGVIDVQVMLGDMDLAPTHFVQVVPPRKDNAEAGRFQDDSTASSRTVLSIGPHSFAY